MTRTALKGAAVVLSIALAGTFARADVIYWDGGGNWMTPANWSNDAAPSADHTYIINNTTNGTAEASSAAFAGASLEVTSGGTLRIGSQAANTITNTLILSGGIVDDSSSGNNRALTAAGFTVTAGTTSTVSVSHADGVLGMNGALSGSGRLVKTGSGRLDIKTVSGNFGGVLEINGGTLGADSIDRVSNASILLASGAVWFRGDTFSTHGNNIELAGGVLQDIATGTAVKSLFSGTINVTADTSLYNWVRSSPTNADRLGGTLTGAGNLVIAGSSAANVTFDAALDSSGYTGAIDFSYNGNLYLNADSVHLGGLKSSGGAGYGTVSRAIAGTTTLTLQPAGGKSHDFSGLIADGSGTVAVVKTGPGAQTLSGANTFTGGTIVNGGLLIVGNANALGTTGTITVNAGGTLAVAQGVSFSRTVDLATGGTLGGNGTFASEVQVDAGEHIAPGLSVGKLTFNSLTLGEKSVLDFEFDASDPDHLVHDQIVVLNDLVIDSGGVRVNLYENGTTNAYFAPGVYSLIKINGLYGDGLGDLNFGLAVHGLSTSNYSFGIDPKGEWITLTITGVPEPATMAFLALGGLAMAGNAIRRRRQA